MSDIPADKKPMLIPIPCGIQDKPCAAMMTPVIFGVRHMVGIYGDYVPEPSPTPPPGGSPVAANNTGNGFQLRLVA